MTDTAGIEEFYGAAILLLRWWSHRWGRRKLAALSGVSATSISNYERRKTVPSPEVRKKLVGALGVSLKGLDLLAAEVQRGMIGLQAQTSEGIESAAAEITAALADDFRSGAFLIVQNFLSSLASGLPTSSEQEIRALSPVLRGIDVPSLQTLVEKAPSLKRWAFVKLVGEESAQAASTDAKRASALADLALWVAEQVPGNEGWQSRAFAWAFVGNARRVLGDLQGAEGAFGVSTLLRQDAGSEDRPTLQEVWRLLDLEASLRIDRRELPQALRLLAEAARQAPQNGAVQARLLSKVAHVCELLDDPQGAIAALKRATSLVDREAEPRLLWMLQFNLMDSLCSSGHVAETEGMLPELRRLQTQVGNGLNLIRLRWLEGRIAAGLGRIAEAIEALSAVRASFHAEEIRYDEALAGLELAVLYQEQGRTAEVKALVRQMEPAFRDQGVHEEARKALLLFRRAVELETVTLELVRRVAVYLHRARNNPELRFAG